MAQNWGSKSRLRKTRSVEVVRFSAGMLSVSSKEFKTNTLATLDYILSGSLLLQATAKLIGKKKNKMLLARFEPAISW